MIKIVGGDCHRTFLHIEFIGAMAIAPYGVMYGK